MHCRTIAAGPGMVAIVCGSRTRRPGCSVPGCTGAGTRQCDAPVTRRKGSQTCDKHIRDRCAVSRGPDVDFCPPHAKAAP